MLQCKIDNTEITCLKTSELEELDIIKPDMQRIIDKNKLIDIVKFQLEYNKKYKHFNFSASGPINIHIWNNKKFIIDGQHRMRALEILYKEYSHDIEFYVTMVSVNTIEELGFNYNMINKNTPLPDFSNFENIDKNIPETVASKFQEKYPNIWSKNRRARRPRMWFNYFQESLAFICEELKINDSDELYKMVCEYNKALESWDVDAFKVTETVFKAARGTGIYLGLLPHQNEDYGYEWARRIVEQKSGRIIKKSSTSSKKRVPKKLKNDSWNKYIGRKHGEALCICCRTEIIGQSNFHAGHIISEFNGGKITIDNILPICAGCNSSMGTKNMNSFINEYYPDNFTLFENRIYDNGNDTGNNIFNKILLRFT